MPPVIDARDLYKRYPGFAPVLKGAGIQVEAGEMAAIMGPSGCGKSTMLHILGLLHAPDSGSLSILDKDVLLLNREQTAEFRRENMGFVMQASNLFDHSTVFENVEFPLIYNNVPEQERWERVIRALDLVRLSNRVHYRSNQLSGGEQQRVAIARAMVNNPGILLADEPTGALDAKTSRLIMENFRKLSHEGGVSMIMVTHDPNMADFCDSIYVLEDGRLKRKKNVPTPYAGRGRSFDKSNEPVVRGALVAGGFPASDDSASLRLASRLYGSDLLSRIFSLEGEPLWGGRQNYSLPLGVRHMGFWKKFCACASFLLHNRKSSALWRIWRLAPASQKYGFWRKTAAFGRGRILSAWGEQDFIEFFFASSIRDQAFPAWVCAKLLERPYAFFVDAAALPFFSPVWELLVNDSAFVCCADKSVLNALERQLPKIPKDKFLLLRPKPIILPDDDKGDAADMPGGKKRLEILCMGSKTSPHGFHLAMETIRLLQRINTSLHVNVLGETSFWRRLLVKRSSLKNDVSFPVGLTESGLAELFSAADIFIAYPPAYRGAEFTLPEYVCSAMAFGLCVVAAEMTPGMSEALEPDKNSVLLPSGTPQAIAETISRLGENPDRMAELGKAAKETFKSMMNFSGEMKVVADRMAMISALTDRRKEEKSKDTETK